MEMESQTKKSFLKRFWWILVIIVVLVIIYLATRPKNNSEQSSQRQSNQQQNGATNDSPPVLKNLAVEFAPYNPKTGYAGDFKFVDQGNLESIFWEFGTILAKGTERAHMNPAFEYNTDPNANVMAAADGIVIDMRYQEETKDWEIFTRANQNSRWTIGYDHVTNPTAKKGDLVLAGQKLGGVGPWSNGLGRVELTIGKSEGDKFYSYCPLNYIDLALKAEYEQKVARLMSDYETWMKKPTIFDETKDKVPGCLYNRVAEEEGGSGAQPAD